MDELGMTTPRPLVEPARRPLVIGVDVDEVCCDLLTEWLRRYNADWDDALGREQCTQWDMTKLVRPNCGPAIYDYLQHPDLYEKVEPIPGAALGVARLRAAGHEVHFITSCVDGPMEKAKFYWLERHGFLAAPGAPRYHAVGSSHDAKRAIAERLKLDVLIDDRPENLEAMPERVARILFDAPHNRDRWAGGDLNARRAASWSEVTKLVDEYHASHAFTHTLAMETLFAPNGPDMKPTLTNPKDLIGTNKVPLDLWPTTATAVGALGMLDGALKYGRDNYRAIGIRPSIYVAACKRHLDAWMEGEEHASDSGVPHLGHALACLAIIVDAAAAGKMVDDRKVKGGYAKLMAELTPIVAQLRERHKDKAPKHFTISDTIPPEDEAA